MTVDIVGLKWYNIIIIYVKRGLLYMRSNQEIQHRNLEVEDYLKKYDISPLLYYFTSLKAQGLNKLAGRVKKSQCPLR